MKESRILRDVRDQLSRGPVRLFPNPVGKGWAGGDRYRKATRATRDNLAELRAELRVGDVVVPNGRPIDYGLRIGSSDRIGWRSVEITPEMVGKTVAVFVSLEGKARYGRLRSEQANWLEQVRAAGGLAGVARSVEEAREVLRFPAAES